MEGQTSVEARRLRLLSAFRGYHYERLENMVGTIIEDKESYEWFVGQIDLEDAKDRLLEIFREIKDVQTEVDFERLLDAPLSEKKIEEFRRDCLKGYVENRRLCALIKRFQSSHEECSVERWSGKPALVYRLEKERFLEHWHVGFVGHETIGDWLGQIETQQFSKWLEDHLEEVQIVGCLGELINMVNETTNQMRGQGFQPNVVLIPEDHVYRDCFTSTASRERTSRYRSNELPNWVAELNGMQVFVWPRCEQACVVVLDVDKFLALEEDRIGKYAPLKIELNEIPPERMNEILRKNGTGQLKKEFEASRWDVATFAKTKLDLRITANVRLGVVELGAGAKLVLDENKLGVICDKKERICHRVGCELANEIRNEEDREMYRTAALAIRGHHYRPCQKCRPLLGRYD